MTDAQRRAMASVGILKTIHIQHDDHQRMPAAGRSFPFLLQVSLKMGIISPLGQAIGRRERPSDRGDDSGRPPLSPLFARPRSDRSRQGGARGDFPESPFGCANTAFPLSPFQNQRVPETEIVDPNPNETANNVGPGLHQARNAWALKGDIEPHATPRPRPKGK